MKAAILIVCCAVPLALCAPVEDQATIQRSFSGVQRIEVDNLDGFVHVTGYDGQQVELNVQQHITADTPEKLEQARREVKLDIGEQGGTLRLYVDGPFRCKCDDGSMNFRGWRHYGYRVQYDFELRAPRNTAVSLRTVNHGDIKVAGIAGDYDLNNINGGVQLLEASGSGRAYALNGGLKATFRRNPRGESYFGSLNGPVDLYFQPDLAADLRMKTFNGHIYTDFPITSLPARAVSSEQREGKHVYRADRFTGARVGKGGPEIRLDGFNGDIRILNRQESHE